MRQDYPQFQARHAEILAIGPDSPEAFQRFWRERDLPFPGLPDPEHQVARVYGQESKVLRLGRLPALVLVDCTGIIRYVHYGGSMRDIPPNEPLLALLDQLNAEEGVK